MMVRRTKKVVLATNKSDAKRTTKSVDPGTKTESYRHPEAALIARPEAGQQARFKKRKPKATYRYDSSLAPEMNWDGQNPAREHGEWLIGRIEEAAKLKDTDSPFAFTEPKVFASADGKIVARVTGLADATEQLRRLAQPFLNWSGKSERLSFNVPTLPLFVHERLSTQAIIETLKSHRKDVAQASMLDLFGDPQRPLADAIVKAYEHQDKWVNRLILGDSLVVMNSLLQYESLGGQVQMIYIDPPYGVKFGSNFQPFIRKRDVSDNDDEDMTREPEMVKAYRDTWELGLHSYLTYLRERLVTSRELLHPTGSIFVQISDENLHCVRQILDEVFGAKNYAGQIAFFKTSSQSTTSIPSVTDYLLVYARDVSRQKLKPLLRRKVPGETGAKQYTSFFSPDLTRMRPMTAKELRGSVAIPDGWKIGRLGPSSSQNFQQGRSQPYNFKGTLVPCPQNRHWSYDPRPGKEMDKLAQKNRLWLSNGNLSTVLLLDDNPTTTIDNIWMDTGTGSFTEDQIYVVQTAEKVISRCIHMTTDPGDLVLDPTCGSGTTASVAELWGRRWITTDTSRVPLALARQRLLSATFPYFELRDETRGPVSGFVYSRRRNRKSEEVGGLVPYITLKNVANDDPPEELVLLHRPDRTDGTIRVTGPFCVEATIPTPLDLDCDGEPDDGTGIEDRTSFVDRMLDTLRRAPILQFAQGHTVTLKNIRQPAKTLALSAEAMVDATADGQKAGLGDVIAVADETNRNALPFLQRPVAIVFGPENGAVSERLVYEAAQEAAAKKFTHLYVIGFSIQPNAENLIGQSDGIFDIPATWVPVTPDVVMGDLLKTTRASQIFSIAGRPEIDVVKVAPEKTGDPQRWQVMLNGLDTFDPVTMAVDKLRGDDVPCWMLDTDYNGRVFHASQVFFPRTKAWESLKKVLKATHDDSVWDHLAGSTSAPFEAGEQNTIAVKVIDDRGNELMVVKKLVEVR